MEKQKKIKRCASDRVLITIFYILVAIFAIVCLYPLLLAIGTSFADDNGIFEKIRKCNRAFFQLQVMAIYRSGDHHIILAERNKYTTVISCILPGES